MSFADALERPAKKRRFFVEEAPGDDHTFAPEPSGPDEVNALPEAAKPIPSATVQSADVTHDGISSNKENGFDPELFTSFVGQQAPPETIVTLQKICGDNIERAINMYLDGSWKAAALNTTQSAAPSTLDSFRSTNRARQSAPSTPEARTETAPRASSHATLFAMPQKRYIGALGVAGWTTRSGTGLITAEEEVKIERAKPQTPAAKGRFAKAAAMKRQDVIVRFTNMKGEEVGRLERESAAWISSLIDQEVCAFEGHCIFAPDRIKVNDTVYLQLKCFLLKRAFEAGSFVKPLENNRQTGIFEAKETEDERRLRLRQVSLVKLFHEINLRPSRINDMAEKHKREGILQAAEIAEQYDQGGKKSTQTPENGGSTPDSDEEEGQELEQDQLDTLYRKAQSFDFDTPEYQPADTFAMDLRKYQKQALHWMVSKETDQKQDHKEQSMHPLWEEYEWPSKDTEDKDLPQIDGQDRFYVNPYSGELSLDFPVQEQNCLGGILADGEPSYIWSTRELLTQYRNGSWQNDRDAQSGAFSHIRVRFARLQKQHGKCSEPTEIAKELGFSRACTLYYPGRGSHVVASSVG